MIVWSYLILKSLKSLKSWPFIFSSQGDTYWLVVSIPLKNYEFVSWDDDIPNWMEKKHVQKATIYIYVYIYIYTHMYICSMVKIHTNQNLFLLWSSHHHSGFLWDFLGISMASTGQVWTGPLGPLGISDSTGWNGRRLGQFQGLPSHWDRWDRIAPTWGSPSKMASWKVPYIYI